MDTAKSRYDFLCSDRSQFLDMARQAANLTLPYLIRGEEDYQKGARNLHTPWQSTGSKGVVTLAAKLMLALLPPNTSFFKLQIDDSQMGDELPPEIRSELDLSFAKVERMIMEDIAASDDRVVIHQALKHLVVSGNTLIYMGPNGLKMYPLNRFVVDRDGDGNVIEIVTREKVNKKLIKNFFPDYKPPMPNEVSAGGGLGGVSNTYGSNECDIYTHVIRKGKKWEWYQEIEGKPVPNSNSSSPVDVSPWIVLTMNHVDGESYGRGRVEEFIGDLKSLEALSQALVEGSAAAAKVVFTVSPSSTTKPATLAKAGNGAIVQGRPDDISVVQVGKTADFKTAFEMVQVLSQRISEAFLILNVRNSERTTAEEVRMTQNELETQLGGLFSLLTVEFLKPYLDRKLMVAQKKNIIPKLPKKVIKPTIVAGVNAIGRGQDAEQLGLFLTTIAQTMGPQAIQQYVNPDEVIKRLAAAQGIDVLNLVKSQQELQAEQAQQMQAQQQMALTEQAGQFAQVEQKREENATNINQDGGGSTGDESSEAPIPQEA